jgi:SAM-dependent methyltransferase
MRCRICRSEAEHPRFEALEMMFGWREPFGYFQCSACGCLQIETVPDDLPRFYGSGYYSYGTPAYRNALTAWLNGRRDAWAIEGRGLIGRALHRRRPRQDLLCLRPLKLAPEKRSARILDVGCGAGHFLYALRERGYTRLLGVDPFIDADIRYANGLVIERKAVAEVAGEWDVITFHHSFEHIPDQQATLAAAARLLAPGGVCVLRLPVVDSAAWHEYGVHWVQLDAPRHLYLHTQLSVRALAQQAGLRLDAVAHDSTGFQFWGSEQYRQGIPLRDPRSLAQDPRSALFSAEQRAGFERRAEQVNAAGEGDQAAFYLRRA